MQIRALFQAVTTAGTPPVNQDFDVSGLTETPKAGLYECTSSGGGIANHYRYSGGITDGTTHRALGALAEDNVLLNADAEIRFDVDTVVQSTLTTSNALNGEARMTEFHAGGSRLAWDDLCATALLMKSVYFLGDDIQCAVREFSGSSSVDGTAVVNDLSFAPNFLFALSHYGVYSADATSSPMRLALGYAVQAVGNVVEQIAHTDRQSDRPTTTEGGTVIRDDCFLAKVNNGSDGARLSLSSWDPNGVTIQTKDVGESVTTALLLVRFPGARLRAFIPSLTLTSTGNKAITGVGFKPDTIFGFATALTTKNTSSFGADTSKWCHGIIDSVDVQGCVSMQAEDNVGTSDTRSETSNSQFLLIDDDAGATAFAATFVSKDNDGLTINVGTAAASNFLTGMVFIGPGVVAAETVGISDASLIVTSALHSGETVGIADAQVIIDSALHSSETVGIADGTVIVTSVLRSDETVDIQDASVIVTSVLESDETVGITETTALVTSVFRSDETVGITDATVLVFSALESDETVSIQDEALLVTSALEDNETVGITEEIEFFTALEANETVSILDASVFVSSTDAGALIANETVGITEAQLFTSYIRDDETVGILDNALLVFTALEIDETETIFDGAALAGTGTAATANETVGITDASQFVFGRILQNSETVGILDGFSFGAGLIPGRAGPGRGRTVEGGAERGRTVDGGSVKGETL